VKPLRRFEIPDLSNRQESRFPRFGKTQAIDFPKFFTARDGMVFFFHVDSAAIAFSQNVALCCRL
jgi:hypothetical protein